MNFMDVCSARFTSSEVFEAPVFMDVCSARFSEVFEAPVFLLLFLQGTLFTGASSLLFGGAIMPGRSIILWVSGSVQLS